MENVIEAEIINILEREFGIARSELLQSSRLLQDLEIDGDDATKLFQIIHDKFRTDFRSLNNHWAEYFNDEGFDSKKTFTWIVLLIFSSVMSGFAASYFSLPKIIYEPIAVLTFFGLVRLVGRLLPKKHLLPITIGGLSEVVGKGVWPDRATEIS